MRRLLAKPAFGPSLIAWLTLLAVVATISPAGNGPGVTCDEYYDTAAGKNLVQAWRQHGLRFFTAPVIDATFDVQTRHPPLGRWLLGWTHALFDPSPGEPFLVYLVGGRLASACEFAFLVFVVGFATSKIAGHLAGAGASFALATMPRSFADAHFATLDTPTSLFFVLAILALASAASRLPLLWPSALAGLVAGLAMATKMHGFLLAPVAAIVLIRYGGRRGAAAFGVWALTALAVFFAAWPWLWIDPLHRMAEYLNTATVRGSLHAFYWGQVWSDREVPWHYPWIMFAVCQPLGWLLLGGWGLRSLRGKFFDRPLYCAATVGIVVVLAVFSFPGVPVYDGVRLFLMVFPLWAIFVGLGIAQLFHWASGARRLRPLLIAATALVMTAQVWGVVSMHPYQLSYYNAAVGGLAGAERLGFEVTYWGDTIARPIIDATARDAAGEPVYYAPQLAPFQADSVQISMPELDKAHVTLVGSRVQTKANWMLVYRRRADLAPIDAFIHQHDAEVAAEVSRQGVWLARLYRLRADAVSNP